MSVTQRKMPILSTANPQAVISGSVSGDTTTITSIRLTQTTEDWHLGIEKSEMPSVTIINGVQYRWTIKSTFNYQFMDGAIKTLVKEAVLNIGTKLTIKKPFFEIIYGEDPVNKGIKYTFSFYDLGYLSSLTMDLGANDFEMDGKTAVPINIDSENNDSMFDVKLTRDATYRFIWSIGDKKYSVDKKLASGATSIHTSYTVPTSWNEALPNVTRETLKTEVQAIFGTTVYQSMQKFVTAYVPESCVPVINSISIADTKGRVPSSWGMFVQENSNVALKAISVTPSHGSQITSVVLKVNNKSYSGTLDKLPQSPALAEYGILDITVTVKDQRLRTAEKTARITVVEYDPPTLQVDSMRCDEYGETENEGQYFLASTQTGYSTCNGKNTITLQMWYKLSSDAAYTKAAKTLNTGSAETVCGGDLDTELSYDVKYVLKDKFNTVTVIDYVSTGVYTIHFLHGGRGIAFGSKATMENTADFAFDALFRGNATFTKPNGEKVTFAQIIEKLGL